MQNLTRRVRDLSREPLELQDRPQPDQGHVHDLKGERSIRAVRRKQSLDTEGSGAVLAWRRKTLSEEGRESETALGDEALYVRGTSDVCD